MRRGDQLHHQRADDDGEDADDGAHPERALLLRERGVEQAVALGIGRTREHVQVAVDRRVERLHLALEPAHRDHAALFGVLGLDRLEQGRELLQLLVESRERVLRLRHGLPGARDGLEAFALAVLVLAALRAAARERPGHRLQRDALAGGADPAQRVALALGHAHLVERVAALARLQHQHSHVEGKEEHQADRQQPEDALQTHAGLTSRGFRRRALRRIRLPSA
jgi:hypothetical protein